MISVRVIIGDGGKEADKISDELISEERIAELRGAKELHDLYWHRTTRSVGLRYREIQDGQVVRAIVPLIADGNYLCQAASISIEPATGKILQQLDLLGEFSDP